jgi:hypothetical protein
MQTADLLVKNGKKKSNKHFLPGYDILVSWSYIFSKKPLRQFQNLEVVFYGHKVTGARKWMSKSVQIEVK